MTCKFRWFVVSRVVIVLLRLALACLRHIDGDSAACSVNTFVASMSWLISQFFDWKITRNNYNQKTSDPYTNLFHERTADTHWGSSTTAWTFLFKRGALSHRHDQPRNPSRINTKLLTLRPRPLVWPWKTSFVWKSSDFKSQFFTNY